MRRLTIVLLAVLPAASLAACGNERQHPPRAGQAADPVFGLDVKLPRYGVRFLQPANWPREQPKPPQIASVNSGQVSLNIWRYPRQEMLPRNPGELLRARSALVAAARARDRTLRVLSSRTLRLRGVPAVELVALEKVGLARRKVRSTHLYAYGGEVVVDAYAPPGEFAQVDRSVFGPVLRSVRLLPPEAPRRS
ncbi:MAG: hypothetical protein QOE65_1717 [Solirubrobacteraceae bacterium]|nr:hypothetical protein [Solirubrobacteraceae bacterium]